MDEGSGCAYNQYVSSSRNGGLLFDSYGSNIHIDRSQDSKHRTDGKAHKPVNAILFIEKQKRHSSISLKKGALITPSVISIFEKENGNFDLSKVAEYK